MYNQNLKLVNSVKDALKNNLENYDRTDTSFRLFGNMSANKKVEFLKKLEKIWLQLTEYYNRHKISEEALIQSQSIEHYIYAKVG